MRKSIILLALLVVACTSTFNPAKKAERLVWANYRDCEKILMVDVDTITLGQNLQYRIDRQKLIIQERESDVHMYKELVKEFRNSPKLASDYRGGLHCADSILQKEKRRLTSLDSLKMATLSIANTPAAYQACVCYNYIGNFVWVQLELNGKVLAISKRQGDMLLNPGKDMPGYIEIITK